MTKKLILICLLVITISSCSTAKVELKPEYSKYYYKSVKTHVSCPISWQFKDQRSATESYYKTLTSDTLISWLTESVEKLYPLPDNQNQIDRLNLKLNVKKVYIQHYATSLAGVVLLEIDINGKKTIARGQQTAVNMFSAESEYDRLLNHSLAEALIKLQPKIESACSVHA